MEERSKRELVSKINKMREITKTIVHKINITRASSKFLDHIFMINGFVNLFRIISI